MPLEMKTETNISCAFTGHRNLDEKFDINLLKATVKMFINEGVKRFYCGMAIGFDMIAAEAVLDEKETNPDVELIACIPCPEQDKYFSAEDKKRYAHILSLCDKKQVLSGHYYKGCMLARNRFMVDNCDRVLAYLTRVTDSGTAYTVSYAGQKQKEIYFL